MKKIKWIFLIYKVPYEPSSKRVYVWRKLKKLEAVTLQDAIFVLPYSEKTFEQFQWLAAEIVEMDGEAAVWESYATTNSQEKALIQKFTENVNTQYEGIIQKLNKIIDVVDINKRENLLRNIINEYMDIKYYDYFKSDLSDRIDEIIMCEQKQLNEAKFNGESE
ncbi:MAG: hypothetical protein FWD71_13930 [Oscillospiraceae bacterium]|nr:hypothetical protein [Oscillospiraceae bacterium]